MPTPNTQPLTTIGVFAALTFLALTLAATHVVTWNAALIFVAAFVASGFAITLRYNKAMAQQRRDAERFTQTRERERARLFASLRSRIVQGFPSPLMMIDAERRVVEANKHARDMFGPDVIGNDISFYLRQPSALAVVKDAIASGRPEQEEFQVSSPVERFYTIFANRIDQTDQNDDEDSQSPFFVVIALQDITKSKVSDRMRVDFIANASHELRTPLSALIGFIETLRGPAADDKDAHERFLHIMAQEADRMIRVIDDLLSLSRIELDKHVMPRETVDLASVAKNIEQSLQVSLKGAQRSLNIDIEDGTPAIRGDKDQLIQVFQNLITNAIKYSRPETPIDLVIDTVQGNRIRACVIDQGDGIAAEHIPRLTERFYRVDTARSRQIGGTGLGLAIVKHIVERHNGELQIDSKIGIGTTISMTFPAIESGQNADAATRITSENENA
jgi:two-component system phosphate regulon sensor histidine kinase PhoR